MDTWLVAGWMSGWMDEWVERWKALRWGEILKDEWIPSSSLSALLHFLSFPQLSLSFLWVSVSLCHCFSLCYGLSPSSLSLSYSDQMSNSCDAVAWLINALKEPREVEHNKQTGEGWKKRKRKDLREKPEEELVRMKPAKSSCVIVRRSFLFPHLSFSLFNFRKSMLGGTVREWIDNKQKVKE